MATAIDPRQLNGTTIRFVFPYKVLDKTHVAVDIDGVPASFTMEGEGPASTEVSITVPDAEGIIYNAGPPATGILRMVLDYSQVVTQITQYTTAASVRPSTLNNEFGTLYAKLDAVEAEADNTAFEISVARDGEASLNDRLDRDYTDLDGRVVAHESELSVARDGEGNLGGRLDRDYADLSGQIASNDGEISALDGRVTVNEEDIAQLEEDVGNIPGLPETLPSAGTLGNVLRDNGTLWQTGQTLGDAAAATPLTVYADDVIGQSNVSIGKVGSTNDIKFDVADGFADLSTVIFNLGLSPNNPSIIADNRVGLEKLRLNANGLNDLVLDAGATGEVKIGTNGSSQLLAIDTKQADLITAIFNIGISPDNPSIVADNRVGLEKLRLNANGLGDLVLDAGTGGEVKIGTNDSSQFIQIGTEDPDLIYTVYNVGISPDNPSLVADNRVGQEKLRLNANGLGDLVLDAGTGGEVKIGTNDSSQFIQIGTEDPDLIYTVYNVGISPDNPSMVADNRVGQEKLRLNANGLGDLVLDAGTGGEVKIGTNDSSQFIQIGTEDPDVIYTVYNVGISPNNPSIVADNRAGLEKLLLNANGLGNLELDAGGGELRLTCSSVQTQSVNQAWILNDLSEVYIGKGNDATVIANTEAITLHPVAQDVQIKARAEVRFSVSEGNNYIFRMNAAGALEMPLTSIHPDNMPALVSLPVGSFFRTTVNPPGGARQPGLYYRFDTGAANSQMLVEET